MFFDDLAAQCVSQYSSKFRPGVVSFQQLDEPNAPTNARGLRGRIVCTGPDGRHDFGRWLVRYFYLQPPQPQLDFHVFWAEWLFYSRLAPAFERLQPLHRVLPLSCWRVGGRVAGLMLHLPDRFEEAQLRGHLDYAHLALMAAALGRFHANSFRLTAAHVEFLSRGLRPYEPHRSYSRLVMPTLRRCSDALIAGGYLRRCANPAAFWRLLHKLLRLDEELRTLAEHGGRYHAFSHQNYTREQVSFAYAGGVPEEARIVEWRSVGWTSLGVDLATLLYVECDGRTRRQHRLALVWDYYGALRTAFVGDHDLPTWDDTMEEIRNCVPVALCVLGARLSHPSGLWDDAFVMQVLEDLVETDMV